MSKEALIQAIKGQNANSVRRILDADPALTNEPLDATGKTALHLAIETRNFDLVLSLWGINELDLNKADAQGETPIQLAHKLKWIEAAVLLEKSDDFILWLKTLQRVPSTAAFSEYLKDGPVKAKDRVLDRKTWVDLVSRMDRFNEEYVKKMMSISTLLDDCEISALQNLRKYFINV